MKISKVDHMKTSISVQNRYGEGILYRYPGEENVDTRKHIEKLNEKAKKLYSLFVPCQISDKDEKNAYKTETKFFDQWAKKYLMNESVREPVLERKKDISFFDTRKAISAFVSIGLRNSLRRSVILDDHENVYVPEILSEMMYLAISEKKIGEIRKQITAEVFEKVAAFVKEDYTKENRMRKIANSIENNNVKVQIADRDGDTVLQLSNAEHPKKGNIFRFIREYTASGEEQQKEMLIHIRKLIILYFCGLESLENADVQEWSFGNFELDDAMNFSDDAMNLINEIAQTPGKEKAKKRNLSEKLKAAIRDEIASHYQDAVKMEGLTESDIYWLQYFERIAEKEIRVKDSLNPRKLSVRFLCNIAWKEWVSFIAMKYVDMGKAVYHFAMPDLSTVSDRKQLKMGEIQPQYHNGISSFDYERVKARESLERELSQYIAFAVNNFSRTICSDEFRSKKGNEDILSVKNPELLPDTRRRILQYFGGASAWEDSAVEVLYEDQEIAEALKTKLADVRNSNFHYTGRSAGMDSENDEIVSEFIEHEISQVGRIYRKKYYANNALMFYKESSITKLMDHLYDGYKMRPAQIPAFQKIINRANLGETIAQIVKGTNKKSIYAVNQGYDLGKNFEGAFFFMLKEIYYYDFLQLKDLPKRFYAALDQMNNQNKEALDNFKKRLDEIHYKELSFGEICQYIMTDYNQQNNDKKKHVSAVEKTVTVKGKELKKIEEIKDTSQKYKHFRTLLYMGIKGAFLSYLLKENAEFFEFLREPVYVADVYQRISEEEFCSGWECHVYDDFKEQDKAALQSYYVCAHFLNPKYLNHMIGSVKNYIQYRTDIEHRAKGTKHLCEDIREEMDYYEDILRMLEFCMLFTGQISHELNDYFDSEDDYIAQMEKYIQYGKGKKYDVNPLKLFCEDEISIKTSDAKGKKKKISRKIGTYYDGLNPILNRNMIMAKLYGGTKTVDFCFRPINRGDFQVYYNETEELSQVFHRGYCETEDEQRRLRLYQNHKNRIELVDVLVYSELINDLMSQLISWAYLRERDLMYLQLGYYYIKLYHTDSVPENHWMRQLSGDEVDIADGAILYQIAAMYTYELPVYELKDGVAYAPEKAVSTGANIGRFLKKYCQGDREEQEKTYLAGLCFFENVNDHDKLTDLRNYVDHFKYFTKSDQSILELYSQMYDSFLSYDVKLKKSVTYILKNILLRYFVDVGLTMGCADLAREDGRVFRGAKIEICEENLRSDFFTYKIFKTEDGRMKPNGEVRVKVREDEFIRQLREILRYKE